MSVNATQLYSVGEKKKAEKHKLVLSRFSRFQLYQLNTHCHQLQLQRAERLSIEIVALLAVSLVED